MNVYGTPAGSLNKSKERDRWADSKAANAGKVGEVAVAKMLADTFVTDEDVHVFHDLRIPGYRANIDHAVVRGTNVLLLDAKRWGSGFYWTVFGQTRRGTERIEWADTQTMAAAERLVTEAIDKVAGELRELRSTTLKSALIVVPASTANKPSLWAYRPAEGLPVKTMGPTTGMWVKRQVRTRSKTPEALVNLLWRMCIDRFTYRLHGQGP